MGLVYNVMLKWWIRPSFFFYRTSTLYYICIWQLCHEYYIYNIKVHCRKIHNVFVRALETGIKESRWWAFRACFATNAKQINFIFNDNVRILCLSCNIKKLKTTAILSENSWNKCSNRFQWCHLWLQRL